MRVCLFVVFLRVLKLEIVYPIEHTVYAISLLFAADRICASAVLIVRSNVCACIRVEYFIFKRPNQ